MLAPEPETKLKRWYRSAGLRVVSDVDLDHLTARGEPGAPDLSVELVGDAVIERYAVDTVHRLSVGEIGSPWLEIRRGSDGYLLRWPGQLDVITPDDGSRMLVAERGPIDDSIARLLLSPAMSFVLPAHGREGLHASAVEIDGRAIVLAGQSGRGKSTLATALCFAGGRLIADDLTVVRLDDDGAVVVDPISTRTWLIREVASDMVSPSDAHDFGRAHKVAAGGDRVALAAGSVPLGALYLLGFRADRVDISDPLHGRQAVLAFIRSLFNFVIRTPSRLTTQFDIGSAIAASIPMRTLGWAPGPEAAAALAERLIADLADPGPLPSGGRMQRTHENDERAPARNGNGNGHASNGYAEQLARKQLLELLSNAGVETTVQDGFDEPLLRTSQVAALLRTSDRTIRAWSDAGKLTYIKTLGGRRLFPASTVMTVMRSMRNGLREEG